MNVAMILAGGVGSRAGFGIPKQFVEILGKPMIFYTIDAFQKNADVEAIEIVCIASHMDKMWQIVEEGCFHKVRWICEGGSTFQDSVINGLEYLRGKIDDDDQVLIHYGDSPMVSNEIISDAIAVCAEHGNASPAMSQVYLAADREDGKSTTTFLDRDEVMVLNAPQAIRYGYALWIYEEGRKRGLLDKVDPHTVSLMLAMGERIWFSKSSTMNIKLTEREDFLLFEGWLLAKQKHLAEGDTTVI